MTSLRLCGRTFARRSDLLLRSARPPPPLRRARGLSSSTSTSTSPPGDDLPPPSSAAERACGTMTDRTTDRMTDRTRDLADALSKPDFDPDPKRESENRMNRRLALSRAITLVESQSPAQMEQSDLLLGRLLGASAGSEGGGGGGGDHLSSRSFRLGIAGPPGAGKSSFIETFGLYLLDEVGGERRNEGRGDGRRPSGDEDDSPPATETDPPPPSSPSPPPFVPSKLAVVCIDPSSTLTGGSILGDKTRMMELSRHDRAFVRPSPSRGTLGGVSAYTDDVVSLCRAAGYDLTIVETVGLGQSEVEISEGADMLLLLVSPGGGDSLQGVKKGIVEMADLLVVNKADGDLLPAARRTAADYRGAMQFLRQRTEGWEAPPVLTASAKTGDGMGGVWAEICRFRDVMTANGQLAAKRRSQARYWMWKHVRDMIVARTKSDPALRRKAERMERALECGRIAPRAAASELLESLSSSDDRRR